MAERGLAKQGPKGAELDARRNGVCPKTPQRSEEAWGRGEYAPCDSAAWFPLQK